MKDKVIDNLRVLVFLYALLDFVIKKYPIILQEFWEQLKKDFENA